MTVTYTHTSLAGAKTLVRINFIKLILADEHLRLDLFRSYMDEWFAYPRGSFVDDDEKEYLDQMEFITELGLYFEELVKEVKNFRV